MRERETLKQVYGSTLSAVDNLRILAAMLESRGVTLNEEEAGFLDAAYECIADAQEAIEAVIPPQELF